MRELLEAYDLFSIRTKGVLRVEQTSKNRRMIRAELYTGGKVVVLTKAISGSADHANMEVEVSFLGTVTITIPDTNPKRPTVMYKLYRPFFGKTELVKL